MRTIRGTLSRLRDDQSGLSMAEVLVASMLTVIMFVMIGAMFVQTSKLTAMASQTRDSNGNASNIANELSSLIRVATNVAKANTTPLLAVDSGTRSSLTVYSLLSTTITADPAPIKMTFTRTTAGVVTETRCPGVLSAGYYTFPTCGAARTIGNGVMAPTGTGDQLFTYVDVNGAPILIGTSSLTDAQRAAVNSIIVTVRTQAANSTTRPVIVSNTIMLRNLGLDTGS